MPLFLGIIVGFFLHDPISGKLNSKSANPIQNSSKFDKTNNLRVDLNSVYRENIILLTSALRRIYNKEPYAPDVVEALNENTQDIADIIGIYYGSDAETEFLLLWKNQNSAYLSYVEALRDKNSTQQADSEKILNNYIESSLVFWKKVNPTFNNSVYRIMLTERINFIKNFINELNKNSITESYKEQHKAYQQNGKIADFLTINIVKQFPDKFK